MIKKIFSHVNMSIFITHVIFFLVSCSSTNNELSYDSVEIESTKCENVKVDTVFLPKQMVSPQRIECLNDSLLILFDPDGGDNSCTVINKDGHIYDCFGRRGKAKTELISPVCMTICGEKVVLYDYSSQKSVSYSPLKNLSNINSSAEEHYYSNIINSEEFDGAALNSFIGLNDGRLLCFGNNKHWITMINNKNTIAEYNDYPILDLDEECNWSLWGHFAEYSISPNNEHLVVGTRIGAAMEIFNISDTEIKPKMIKGFYRPTFDIAQGAIPKCVISTEKTIEGFCSICALNDYFFAIIGGKDCMKRNEILIFDYDGNVLGKRLLPGDVSCLSVMADTMYMIIEFSDGKTKLCKADISAFL